MLRNDLSTEHTPNRAFHGVQRRINCGETHELRLSSSSQGSLPEFTGRIPNNSAPIGRDVTFTCNVKNLGHYKVRQITDTPDNQNQSRNTVENLHKKESGQQSQTRFQTSGGRRSIGRGNDCDSERRGLSGNWEGGEGNWEGGGGDATLAARLNKGTTSRKKQ